MSLVWTCILSLCHSNVLVCHLYATRIYLYVICMSLVCHPHVTCMYLYIVVYSCTWLYHEFVIGFIAIMLLYDLEAKRNFFHTVCPLHWLKQFRNKLKYKSTSYTTSNYFTKLWNFVKMFRIFVNNLRQTPLECTKTLASALFNDDF